MLRAPAAGLVAAFAAAAGAEFATPARAGAQTELTPDAALKELLAGNQRFMRGRMTALDVDLKILKRKTADQQKPFAAVLSCADSRVPVEFIFDQSIGQIFVCRVAGNVITSEIIASLEYGAAVLGTKAIVVLGHANCGAVKAAMQGKAAPGQISTLYRYFQPALDQAGSNLELAIKSNAKIQSELLRKGSTVVADLVKKNLIKVTAAYYDIALGGVTLLE
ncbi:MAG: carbonic anhydrase [Bryobacterales bacterium]|nr:carbonic anhydrase [Bryobacterales bacterium]MBV9399027.1 carbonic anhydrase [Bryobacterales bacterium]